MSGHSHWATTHRHKGMIDAKRAATFTKLGRAISAAAREKGGNVETNWKLKMAIDEARYANMPKEKIERAIKSGTGELKGENPIETLQYEGFGPGQVAVIIASATDNRNRTVSEIKSLFTKGGGKLGNTGGASYLFTQRGLIAVRVADRNQDDLGMLAIEAGADDFSFEDDLMIVRTKPNDLQMVREELEKAGLAIEGSEVAFEPNERITPTPSDREAYEKLREKLEDHDDVQTVWDNLS